MTTYENIKRDIVTEILNIDPRTLEDHSDQYPEEIDLIQHGVIVVLFFRCYVSEIYDFDFIRGTIYHEDFEEKLTNDQLSQLDEEINYNYN